MSKLDEHHILVDDPSTDLGDSKEVTLREAIAKIPGEDGWWKSGSHEEYEKLAGKLLGHNVPADQIRDILYIAY
jgi:hypothetical protein